MLEGDNDTSTVDDLSNFEADVCGGVNAANELTAEGTDISISAETRRHNFFAIIVSLLLVMSSMELPNTQRYRLEDSYLSSC